MEKTTCKPTNRLKRIQAETRQAKRPELWIDDTPLPGFNYWGEHPKAPLDEWLIEVKNGDTRRGYWAWVRAVLEEK
jgi:hypothetical protein